MKSKKVDLIRERIKDDLWIAYRFCQQWDAAIIVVAAESEVELICNAAELGYNVI